MKHPTFKTALLAALVVFSFAASAADMPNVFNGVSAASGTSGLVGPFDQCPSIVIKVWGTTGGSAFSGTVDLYGYNTNASSEVATHLHAQLTTPLDGSEMFGVYPAPRYVKISYTRSAGSLYADVRCGK